MVIKISKPCSPGTRNKSTISFDGLEKTKPQKVRAVIIFIQVGKRALGIGYNYKKKVVSRKKQKIFNWNCTFTACKYMNYIKYLNNTMLLLLILEI